MMERPETSLEAVYPPPVDRLLRCGESQLANSTLWPDYRSDCALTHEHVPDLIRMACDQDLYGGDPDAVETWAPVHAWRSLGQIAASDAVAPLVALLRRSEDDDMVTEELPIVLAMIGRPALPSLVDLVNDWKTTLWVCVAAVHGLGGLGYRHPDCRDACIAALLRLLKRHLGWKSIVNGTVMSALIDLAAVEAIDAIRDAFRRKVVDASISGDEEDVEIALGLRTGRSTPPPFYQRRLMASASKPAKVGRNDPCPCGSGKKYKNCCLD